MGAGAGAKTSVVFLGSERCQWSQIEQGGDFPDRVFLTNAVVGWFQVKERQGQPAGRAL